MTDYYIKPSQAERIILNNIFYPALVTEDGINFKFPYLPGTTSYLNVDEYEIPCPVTEEMQTVAETNPTVAALFVNKKTKEEAIAAGWLPAPHDIWGQ